MTNVDLLYPLVSEAIRRAEALEDLRAPGTFSAYRDVSILEERIAEALPASDPEGALARRGAVRAALVAREFARAQQLVARFLSEPDTDVELKAELLRLLNQTEGSIVDRFPRAPGNFGVRGTGNPPRTRARVDETREPRESALTREQARILTREQAQVLSAISDGAEARTWQKGVDLETIKRRTNLSTKQCRDAIAFLRRKTEGYVVRVPGSAESPRWALSKWAGARLPVDADSADILFAAVRSRNEKSGKFRLHDIAAMLGGDYAEDRIHKVVTQLAAVGYYIKPDQAKGSEYYTIHTRWFRYEQPFIELRRS